MERFLLIGQGQHEQCRETESDESADCGGELQRISLDRVFGIGSPRLGPAAKGEVCGHPFVGEREDGAGEGIRSAQPKRQIEQQGHRDPDAFS